MKTIMKKSIITAITLILFIVNCSYAAFKPVTYPGPTDEDWEKECEGACLLKAKHQEKTQAKTKKEKHWNYF